MIFIHSRQAAIVYFSGAGAFQHFDGRREIERKMAARIKLKYK